MDKIKSPTIAKDHDILPWECQHFRKIYKVAEEIADFDKFGRINPAILEGLRPSSKKSKSGTEDAVEDLVLKDEEGNSFKLSSDGTLSLARAFIEHEMFNLPKPIKLWYCVPLFRKKEPSTKEYEQTWRLGFEIFGSKDLVIDAQIIQIFFNIFSKLKIKNVIIELNSIGDFRCAPYYKKVLKEYLRSHRSSLCANCKKLLRNQPLMIFNCQQEKCQRVMKGAPQMIDHLCKKCHNHFRGLLEFLDEINIPYHLNPYLLNTADYCSRTVFNIFKVPPDDPEGKIILASGGRHDTLIKSLGGKEIPAFGASLDVEKLSALIKGQSGKYFKKQQPKIFLAQLGRLAKSKGLVLFEEFQKNKIEIAESFHRNSLKSQLGRAESLGVKYLLIIGQKEALDDVCVIRNIKTGEQTTVQLRDAVKEMKRRLKKK